MVAPITCKNCQGYLPYDKFVRRNLAANLRKETYNGALMQVVEKVRVAFLAARGQTFSAHLKLNILVVVDLRIFYTIMNAHYQPYL